ncbi:Transcription initiation factor TFIID subunit 8 [Geodia barretti]|uniref:Transcription initiation factor TFIID subunit 8 n=1 Tax=Geodia barretti TaxID=519541 RepID=A0AA35SZ73_GEOBA|nr:Transcription initiation factor TFIID subunit 8 [Geodia barretti]
MEGLDKQGRKQVAQTSVAALCLETGATSVEKGALDALCQLLESYIDQVGRRARDYCEVASRTAPTYTDVELALVDVGTDPASLSEYSKRPQRRHLPKRMQSHSHLTYTIVEPHTCSHNYAHRHTSNCKSHSYVCLMHPRGYYMALCYFAAC